MNLRRWLTFVDNYARRSWSVLSRAQAWAGYGGGGRGEQLHWSPHLHATGVVQGGKAGAIYTNFFSITSWHQCRHRSLLPEVWWNHHWAALGNNLRVYSAWVWLQFSQWRFWVGVGGAPSTPYLARIIPEQGPYRVLTTGARYASVSRGQGRQAP